MKTVTEKKKQDCCGCSLCAEVCPKEALKMVSDEEGFNYPTLDKDLCVNCGLCINVCPFNNSVEKSPLHYYIARSLDEDVLDKSASGGVFTHISDNVLAGKGIVYGAKYTNDFKSIIHSRAINENQRNAFRDSKYVQSSIGSTLKNIIKDLKEGKYVLFTGTPCQCAAIKKIIHYNKVDDTQLLIVDIICHGVGSPKIWKQYLDFMKVRFKLNSIESIITRNKKFGDGYNLTIYSGEKIICMKDKGDPYINLFSRSLILRPSCFHCPMKSWSRYGDITIGDFQKAKQYYQKFKDGKGISVILVNTTKGQAIWEEIKHKMKYEETTKNKSSQISLCKKDSNDSSRNDFYLYYLNNSFYDTLKRYTEIGLINNIVANLKRYARRIFR